MKPRAGVNDVAFALIADALVNDRDNRSALGMLELACAATLLPSIGKAVGIARKMQAAPIGEFLLLQRESPACGGSG